MRKLLNWLLVELSAILRPGRAWGRPTHLQVEPSSLCNLQCSFCPVTTGLQRSTGLMDFETFRKVFDEIAEYLFMVILWDWGEPFLNPEIYRMIRYAKRHDLRVISSTNGHVFAKSDHPERLIESGIDTIIFAVDGLSQETYEQYRKGGSIETALNGLERVVEAKRASGWPRPLINLRFLAMRHNEHELPRLETFARELGVDSFSIKTLNPYDQGECHSTKENGLAYMPSDPHYQRFEYDPRTGERLRVRRNPCKRLWNNPLLSSDGKLVPCAFDPHHEYSFGDATNKPFLEIWKDRPIVRLRRQFRTNYRDLDLCANCTYAFKGGAPSTDTTVKVVRLHT